LKDSIATRRRKQNSREKPTGKHATRERLGNKKNFQTRRCSEPAQANATNEHNATAEKQKRGDHKR
jgi:hypothetical protein